MAFTSDIKTYEAGLVERMRREFSRAREMAGKRRVYRQTLNELQGLSARDLDDLGIAPSQLRSVAYAAAFGK